MPGLLWLSTIPVILCQHVELDLVSVIASGSLPWPCRVMMSMTTALAAAPPAFMPWFHRFRVGSAISAGSPSSTPLITPSASEWSATIM